MAKADFDYIWTDKKRTLFGLPISFTRYYITERKFVTRVGFFNVQEDELDIYTITDKKLNLSFWERIFKCGTITVNAKDTDTPIKVIDSVKQPRRVMEVLDKQVEAQRDKYHIRGRDMMGVHGDDCDCDCE